jgi:hypothetical protein
MLSNSFDVLIFKINFKNKKYYLNIFSSKKTLKNNNYRNINQT